MSVATIFYKYKTLYEEVQELESSMDPHNENYVWREYEEKRALEEKILLMDSINKHNCDELLKVPSGTASTVLTKDNWVHWVSNNNFTRLKYYEVNEFFQNYPDGLIQIG